MGLDFPFFIHSGFCANDAKLIYNAFEMAFYIRHAYRLYATHLIQIALVIYTA